MDVRVKIEERRYENGCDFSIDRKAWKDEERSIRERFRKDLAKEHDVPAGPIEEDLWTRAWSDGHSAGLHEVCSYYEQYVEFFNVIKKALTKGSK